MNFIDILGVSIIATLIIFLYRKITERIREDTSGKEK